MSPTRRETRTHLEALVRAGFRSADVAAKITAILAKLPRPSKVTASAVRKWRSGAATPRLPAFLALKAVAAKFGR